MGAIHIEELWQKAKRKYSFPEGMQLKNEQSEILKCECCLNICRG